MTAYSPPKLIVHWLHHCWSAGRFLAICWYDERRIPKVMGWMVLTAEDGKREAFLNRASWDWNCGWVLLEIIWCWFTTGNVQSTGTCCAKTELWNVMPHHWPPQWGLKPQLNDHPWGHHWCTPRWHPLPWCFNLKNQGTQCGQQPHFIQIQHCSPLSPTPHAPTLTNPPNCDCYWTTVCRLTQ